MATYFGDYVDNFSRAVDDEEDEEERIVTETCVRWTPLINTDVSKQKDKKLQCQSIIIAIGPAAAGFVQSYILDDDYYVIGALFSGMAEDDINTFDQMSPTDKCCYIYRSRSIPDMFLCICKTEVSPEQSYSWVDQLFSKISTQSAFFYASILCTCPTSEYRGETPTSDLNPPFMRGLKTSRYPGTPPCPYLEQPNLLPGLPAQLLTHFQVLDAKAVLYLCYTDTIYLDHATVKAFLPILKTTPIKDIIKENSKSEEQLNIIVDLYSAKNNLYL